MKKYYVYMLRCADGSFYIGITNDAERRVAEHEMGLIPRCYTYTRRPVQLVYVEDFHDVLQAIAVEKKLKGWTRAKKAALANRDWKRIQELAACKNKTKSPAPAVSP